MTKSDSFYEPYLLVGILGLFAFYKNKKNEEKVKITKLEFGFASFLTICILLANYKILNITLSNGKIALCLALLNLLILFYVIYMLFRNILVFLLTLEISDIKLKPISTHISERKIFIFSFFLILIINLIILVLQDFPSVTTTDSYRSIKQIFGINEFDNAQDPLIYKLLIGLFINAGTNNFGTLEFGVFSLGVAQIVFMSLVFAYCLKTIFQATNNLLITIICFVFFLFLPLNLTYSHSIWKDIPFSLGVLLFAVSSYRFLERLGKQFVNILIVAFSAILVCTMRHNGFIAFFVFVILCWLFYHKNKIFNVAISISLVVSLVFVNLFANVFHACSVDDVEKLSIPLQQIARVIVEEKTLTNEEFRLIESIVSIDDIREKYNEHISDPIKDTIRSSDRGGSDFIGDNKRECIMLYIELGTRYPLTYLKAWIEQTKGFWNAGYDRIIDRFMPSDAELDMNQTVVSNEIRNLFEKYLLVYRSAEGIKLFASIGLYFWFYICALYVAAKRKNKILSMLILLILLVVGTYLISTPLYVDYRYSYYLFCSTPLIFACLFAKNNRQGV